MLRQKSRIVLLFGLFCLTILSAFPSVAKGGTSPGIDVVIIIDQSGSMWGARPSFTENDRWDHRIGQAKNIIYRLTEHAQDSVFVHRVIVIDMGDNASLAAPSPLIIQYNPATPNGLLTSSRSWVERYVTAKDLINTNTPESLELAFNQLSKLEKIGDDRRKVILLLTDGRPDLGPGKESLDDLRSRIESITKDFDANKIELWLVAINDASNYWNEGDGEFWQKVAGTNRARLAETASTNIAKIVQDIVNQWLEIDDLEVKDEFDCPPYLRRIIFDVNFSTPRSSISITDPNGAAVPLSSGGGASSPGTFSRFVMDDPKPGIYKINKDSSRAYTTFVEMESPHIQRLKPSRKTSIAAESEILFQVTDSSRNVLEMKPEFPLETSVVITSDTGNITEIPAENVSAGKFKATWKPPALGKFKLKLKGIYTFKDGKKIDVFGFKALADDETLEVDDSQPFYIRFVQPDSSKISIFPWNDSTNVKFELVDSKKEKVANPESVIKDPKSWLAVQVIDKSDVPMGSPIPLSLDSNNNFTASLPVSLNWKNGEGWLNAKRMDFLLIAQSDRLPEKTYLDSLILPSSENLRINSDSLTSGNFSLGYSRLFIASILIIFLLILALTAFLILRLLIPNLLVRWTDKDKRQVVNLKIYDGDEDPDGDFAQKIQLTSKAYVNADRTISIQINGKQIVAQKLRIKRDIGSEPISVSITYSWNSEPKKVYTARVAEKRPRRLEGLSENTYFVSIEVKKVT